MLSDILIEKKFPGISGDRRPPRNQTRANWETLREVSGAA
jgi:hypothetical protein